MLDFEQAREALTALADELPQALYRELNGGVMLLPEAAYHTESCPGAPLYIMGQYNVDPRGFGRYIAIYYGSFVAVHGQLEDSAFVAELGHVLRHELTHHIESLAGDATLEYIDEDEIDKYRRWYSK